MNLIVDIGNSAAKVALVQDSQIIATHCYEHSITPNIITTIGQHEITSAIISTTRNRDTVLEQTVKRLVAHTIILDHTTPTPLINRYGTPQTLGMDRLAAAVGAWSRCQNQELLIFDFGTAITIDRVSRKGEYMGGNISPGLNTRFLSLNNFTEKLPLLDYKSLTRDENQFGKSTPEAIWKGVVQGIEYEIRGYTEQNLAAKIFFTGRDAKYFATSLKSAIFVDYELVIKGLDRILEHNAKRIER